jgi:EpsI family protein
LVDRRMFVAAGMMLSAAVLAQSSRPVLKQNLAAAPNLDTDVPAQFGSWKIDPNVPLVLPPPDLQAVVERTYSQVLSRTYVNQAGQRIMFLVAYTQDQSDPVTQAHSPEICYPAQGFAVVNRRDDTVVIGAHRVSAVRMLARAPGRSEPVSYWVTVGETVPRMGIEARLASMRYMLTGGIPDGMLVRVSCIDANEGRGYTAHDLFLNEMEPALAQGFDRRLLGATA